MRKSRIVRRSLGLGLGLLSVMVPSVARSAVVVTSLHSTNTYAVSNTDLLQGVGTSFDASLLNINVAESAGYTVPSLTDGLFPNDDRALAIASGVLTYTLDTTINNAGYDVTSLATYGGWANWARSEQQYSVAYASVANPTNFVNLVTNVDSGYYVSDTPSYTAVWLTNNVNAPLATGVKAIRFTFPAQLNGGAGYREFDLFGSPSPITQTNSPTVIFYDSFSRQGNLAGSAPDRGAVHWTADPAWQLSGSNAQVTVMAKSAFLPFQPRSSNVYTLSALLNCTSASPSYEWIALGYANGFATSGAWHTVNNPVGWMLLRFQSDTNNQAQAFLGPGNANGTNVGVYSGEHTFAVVLDTRPTLATNWTFQYKIDGQTVWGPVAYGSTGPTITSVGMGNGAGLGWVDDFTLSSLNDDSVYQSADIAAGIRAVTTPMRGSTNLVLPVVTSGYQLSIKSSSNPSVIATNGVINPPLTNTVLQLVLTVTRLSDGQTADTGLINLFVPSWKAAAPFVQYPDNFTMRRGLFISWSAPPDGQANPIVFSDGTKSTTIDQFTTSANVPAVVNQIASLGFEYIILTDFHGYQTTLHPCAALDSWRGPGFTSTRDLVGEVIAGLKARGIRVYLFTHPLDGYDGYTPEQQALVGWFDPTGKYQRWNDFINDVFAELVERYGGDIAGIQFDSDFGMSGDTTTYQKLDLNRLRETILSRRPQLSLSALAGPNDTAELGIKEIWRPSWLDPWGSLSDSNYNVEIWPAYLRVPAVVQGYHWAAILPPAQGLARMNGSQLFRYSVLQAAVGTEGPGIAWAASPYTDGTWENGVGEAFTNLNAYVQLIAESMRNVLPSTSYPLAEGVWLSTLPNGIAATRSIDGTIEYLHVLNPPSNTTLVLPLPTDGKRFLSAALVTNGHAVSLVTNLSGISLTLNSGDSWNPLDTVIKLRADPTTVPQLSLAFHRPVSASSSVEFGPSWGTTTPWGRIRLVDGQTAAITPTNGWSAGNYGFSTTSSSTNCPAWISNDLESTNWVNTVRLHPRNDSGNLGYGYPVNFNISTSTDGVNWTLAASLTNQPKPTTAQTFNFSTRSARYVRLYASELRPNPNDGGSFELQFSELEVFGLSSLSSLTLQKFQNSVVLQWTNGVLQSAGSVGGSFTDVRGALSPFTNNAALLQQFYRLRF
jgi:hypothetical protein